MDTYLCDWSEAQIAADNAVQKVSARRPQHHPFYKKSPIGRVSQSLGIRIRIHRKSISVCVCSELAKIADPEDISENPLAVSAQDL